MAATFAVAVALLGLSLGGLYQGRNIQGVHPMVITALGITASTPFAGVGALLEPGEVTNWPHAIALLAVIVVVSSIGATTLYAMCIGRAGARSASILFAVIPATATLMAWIALGEPFSVWAIIGIALGAAACGIQAADRRKKAEN